MAETSNASACWHSLGALPVPSFTGKELERLGFSTAMQQRCGMPVFSYGGNVAVSDSFLATSASAWCTDKFRRGYIVFLHHRNGTLMDYFAEWFMTRTLRGVAALASEPRLDRLVHATFRFVTNRDRVRWGDLAEESSVLVVNQYDPSGKAVVRMPYHGTNPQCSRRKEGYSLNI